MKRDAAYKLLYTMKLPLASLALLAACTAVPDESTVASALGGSWQTSDCPHSDCGLNTNVIKGVYFSSLHLDGTPNDAGIVLSGYVPGTLPPGATRLDVWKDRLVAVDNAGNLKGERLALKNVEMKLVVEGKTYALTIANVNIEDAKYWAANDGTRVETYTFTYRLITSSISTNMCRSEPAAGNKLKLDAVVFEGELYDPLTKQISIPTEKGWFNIACMGSAVAKEFMMRHARASSNLAVDPPIATSPDERQALLNAWTGNYCGDGTSFTRPGEKLRMRDNKGWISHDSGWSWMTDIGQEPAGTLPQLASYEAIWDGKGAVCLDVPRREDTDPGITEKILEHCEAVGHPLEPCSETGKLPENWESRGHILTANPFSLVALPLIAP